MRDQTLFDKIDLHLIRVLHTVLTERSVSRAALRLGMHQPAVSASLRRLRELAGDLLLVRSGAQMQPTDVGLGMVQPSADILRAAEGLFSDARQFDPRTSTRTFRIAASDYLDPQLLPRLMSTIMAQAPHCPVDFLPLRAEAHYEGQLADGEIDVVIGNWPQPPEGLHMAKLFEDEVVCLVSPKHPAVRRGWDVAQWLQAEHIAPTPAYPGAQGVIDEQLAGMGLSRQVAARCAHFSLIPDMVASSLLVMTSGRLFCERFSERLPLAILPCPVEFPPLVYYQLWHARSHVGAATRWLREVVRNVALTLRNQ